MVLGVPTRIFLQEEGITTVGDLVDFTENKIWRQVIGNFKRPTHVAPAGGGALILQEPFLIVAKLLMCLKVSPVTISYYESISCPLTTGNIEWDPRINNLSVQRKAIQYPNNNDYATLPKISKTVSIVKWFEAYESHVSQVIGQENSPLTWIIHNIVPVANVVTTLAIV